MRVGRQYLEAPVRDVAAVQVLIPATCLVAAYHLRRLCTSVPHNRSSQSLFLRRERRQATLWERCNRYSGLQGRY